jgi:hypothetical protein
VFIAAYRTIDFPGGRTTMATLTQTLVAAFQQASTCVDEKNTNMHHKTKQNKTYDHKLSAFVVKEFWVWTG